MKDLKIAIDGGPLTSGDSVRGIGVYARELIAATKIDGVDLEKENLGKYDVVHFTRFNPFKVSVPFIKPQGTKFIVTIYDLIPLIYPAHYPPGIRGKINWQINKLNIRKNVDAIITISETSKKDICRFMGIDPTCIYPIHLAPRSIFKPITDRDSLTKVKKKYGLPDSFALYVGDINYNKNIPLLVKVCNTAKIPLVICGKQAKDVEEMDLGHPELSNLKGIDWGEVVRLGFVSDEDLVQIYNLATLYIQPSLYEGFGLPLLEAQAAGLPVVAAKTQVLVEIAEDSALFAEPKDEKDFTEKIKLIISDKALREDLVKKGIENSGKFTWKKTSEKTLKVYRKVSGL